MSFEAKIEGLSWVMMIILLFVVIPGKRFVEAQLNFLFTQALTWLLGALVAQFHLVVYPFRLFPTVFKSNFSYEFFFLPSVSAIFYVQYRSIQSRVNKMLTALSYPTFLTIAEVIALKYTKFIVYVHWAWYYTWISVLLVLIAAYWYTNWVFKLFKKQVEKGIL